MSSIYVGNFPFSTTEDELHSLFKTCGEIKRITIVRDKMTNASRGFAFIEFENEQEKNKAIKLNGQTFKYRTLRIHEAKRDKTINDSNNLNFCQTCNKNSNLIAFKNKAFCQNCIFAMNRLALQKQNPQNLGNSFNY